MTICEERGEICMLGSLRNGNQTMGGLVAAKGLLWHAGSEHIT